MTDGNGAHSKGGREKVGRVNFTIFFSSYKKRYAAALFRYVGPQFLEADVNIAFSIAVPDMRSAQTGQRCRGYLAPGTTYLQRVYNSAPADPTRSLQMPANATKGGALSKTTVYHYEADF